ncbi:hypothetical protein RDWZM_003265 [Blomia tropicalis]|uniref:F-box domain-containing protein n=1 Tax=Blomia tropicalis TaxID=40697 RepID=A0A9Q0MJ83_BLOTA|nr:hypothetical protein RDWZM_003265 [Blomia tropicalis]
MKRQKVETDECHSNHEANEPYFSSINNIPNEILMLIFENLQLDDLLILDQVCNRWNILALSVLRRRRQLTIVKFLQHTENLSLCQLSCENINYKGYFFTLPTPLNKTHNVLKLPEFGRISGEIIQRHSYRTMIARLKHSRQLGRLSLWITEHFPFLESLTIINSWMGIEDVAQLNRLLNTKSIQTNLVTFNIRACFISSNSLLSSFFIRINHLKALKHLTLEVFGHYFCVNPFLYKGFGSVISRLTELNITLDIRLTYNLAENLIRYGVPNCSLRQIGLGFSYPDHFILNNINMLNNRVTRLYGINNGLEDEESLTSACNRFPSLEMLRISYVSSRSNFAKLISPLLKLKHLVDFGISLVLDNDEPFPLDKQNVSTYKIEFPNVQVLSLYIRKINDHNKLNHMPSIFPSAKEVRIYFMKSQCSSCCSRLVKVQQCQHQTIRIIVSKLSNLRRVTMVDYQSGSFEVWKQGAFLFL